MSTKDYGFIDFLIDKALETGDRDWFNELVEKKQKMSEKTKSKKKPVNEIVIGPGRFRLIHYKTGKVIMEGTAFDPEDIESQYKYFHDLYNKNEERRKKYDKYVNGTWDKNDSDEGECPK
jgi:hypothetical protein